MTDLVLGIRLTADGKELVGAVKVSREELEKMRRELNLTEQQSQRGTTENRKYAESLENIARFGKLAGAAITVVAGALIYKIKNTIDAAAALGKLSEETKRSVEWLGRMRHIQDQLAMSGDVLIKAYQQLPRTIVEGIGPNSEASRSFKALGIDPRQLQDIDQAMMLIADRFREVRDPMVQAALAEMIFKQRGEELLPFLNKGAEGIRQLYEESEKYSHITNEGARQAMELKRQWVDLQASGGDLSRMIQGELVPWLNTMLKQFAEGIRLAGGLAGALKFGTMNPFQSWAGHVESQQGEVARLQGQLGDPRYASPGWQRNLNQQLTTAQQRLQWSQWNLRREDEAAIRNNPFFEDAIEGSGNVRNVTLGDLARPGRSGAGDADRYNAAQNMVLALKDELEALTAVNQEGVEFDKLVREITEGTKQWTEAQIASALALRGEIDDIKRARAETQAYIGILKAQKAEEQELNEARARMADIRAQAITSRQQALDLARDEQQIAEYEATLIGRSEAERNELVAVMRAELDVRREISRTTVSLSETEKQWMLDTARQTAQIGAQTDALRQQAREMQRSQADMWQSIERVGHDTWTSIFDTGKSVIDRLRDALKAGILDLLYQITLKRWIVNIAASVSGTGVASQAFGASAVNGTGGMGIMDLLGLGNSASNLFGGSGMFGGAVNLAGNSLAGASWLGTGSMFGSVGGAELAGLAALEGGGALAGGAAMGVGAAAAIPYVGWALAALAVLGAFSGSDKIPTQHLGDFTGTYNPRGNLISGYRSPAGGQPSARNVVGGMYDRYDALVQALGGSYDQVSFTYGANTGKDSQNPNFALSSVSGGSVYQVGENVGAYRTLDEATIALESGRAIVSALQGADLPKYIEQYFDALKPASMDQAAIDNALNFAGALKQLRDSLYETREPIEIMRDSMRELARDLHTTRATYEDDLKAAIKAGLTPETLAQWQRLAQAIGLVTAAEEDLAEARRAEREEIRATRGELGDARGGLIDLVRSLPDRLGITGLMDFRSSLLVSDTLSPERQIAGAQRLYEQTLRRAQRGNLGAIEALPGVAEQYLSIGRDTYASGAGFQSIYKEVLQSTTAIIQNQRDTQADLLREIPRSIVQASAAQTHELRLIRNALHNALQLWHEVKQDLRRLRPQGTPT